MENKNKRSGPSGDGGASSRTCTKCKQKPRPTNSSWCRDCRNEMAAEYRAKQRKKVVVEDRSCAWEGCDATYQWRSSHPRQLCCSRTCYGKWRWRNENPRPEIETLPEGQKACTKCRTVKGLTDFSPSQFAKRSAICRMCWRAYSKEWDARNVERRSAATRRSRRSRLLRKYGAPSDDFDHLLDLQGGGCACCKSPEHGGKGWHIDHDHALPEAASYRGILCHPCNVGIGVLREDPARFRAALVYLQGS